LAAADGKLGGARTFSAIGTNPKYLPHQGMSEFGGEAENICSHGVFRILTDAVEKGVEEPSEQ
jgi:hypothetical protein